MGGCTDGQTHPIESIYRKIDQLLIPTVSATAWQSLKIQSVAASSLKAARRINGDPSSATIYDKTVEAEMNFNLFE